MWGPIFFIFEHLLDEDSVFRDGLVFLRKYSTPIKKPSVEPQDSPLLLWLLAPNFLDFDFEFCFEGAHHFSRRSAFESDEK
jgi:hypothetical protein